MKESRVTKILGKIITPPDVTKLAELVHSEYVQARRKDKHTSITYTARSDDDSTFAGEDPSLFAEPSIVRSKHIVSIRMRLHSTFLNRSIEIVLGTSGSPHYITSKAEVEGDDPKWVNGTLRYIEEIIQGFPPQNAIVRRYRRILEFVAAIGIGAVVTRILIYLSSSTTATVSSVAPTGLFALAHQYPALAYLIVYGIYWLLGSLFSYFLMEGLVVLWPVVELQFGPEHTLIEKKRRARIASFLLLGVLPFLLQVVSDIVRTLMKVGG